MRGRVKGGSKGVGSLPERERAYAGIEPRGGELPVVLAAPNRYRVGMSNLGFQTLLSAARRAGPFDVERLFLPDGDEGPLRTFESGRSSTLAMIFWSR